MQTGGKSRQIKATSKQKDIKNALKILKIIKIFKKNIIKAPKIIKIHHLSVQKHHLGSKNSCIFKRVYRGLRTDKTAFKTVYLGSHIKANPENHLKNMKNPCQKQEKRSGSAQF